MLETLVKIDLPPGLSKRGTVYQTGSRWYDANMVRFFSGQVMPIGGWRRVTDSSGANLAALSGTPRKVLSARLDDGSQIVGFGTTSKFYVLAGGTLNDCTPTGFGAGAADGGYSGGAGTYGYSTYGSGLYGTGVTAATYSDATTWQMDSFGSAGNLVFTDTTNNLLYVWDGDVSHLGAVPAGAPAHAGAVVVTPERFLFALNTVSTGGGTQNARLVRWPSQESTTDWTPSATNTAGEFEIASNGRLLAGRRSQYETLLWTDADVWAARYIGGTLLYQFVQLGDNSGLIAPNACVMLGTQAWWMGPRGFFNYNGYVQPVPCEIADYVFGNMNTLQLAKIWAMGVPEFKEVWWFYPSGMSTEIDRYVCYSYGEGHWTIGKLVRLAGCPSGATTYPIMVDASGQVWEHEVGTFRDTNVPYVESGVFEIGNGDQFQRVQRLVPDDRTAGDVTATFFTDFYPDNAETSWGPFSLSSPTDIRFTARQARVRFTEAVQDDWRVGTPRLGILPAGRR